MTKERKIIWETIPLNADAPKDYSFLKTSYFQTQCARSKIDGDAIPLEARFGTFFRLGKCLSGAKPKETVGSIRWGCFRLLG